MDMYNLESDSKGKSQQCHLLLNMMILQSLGDVSGRMLAPTCKCLERMLLSFRRARKRYEAPGFKAFSFLNGLCSAAFISLPSSIQCQERPLAEAAALGRCHRAPNVL